VAVEQVSTGNIQETLEITGTIHATQDVTVSSKIMGKVARVYVKEGQAVRQGQLLVSLEAADLKTQVKQAQAGVDTAKARLQQAQEGLGIQSEASSTGVVQAQAALDDAKVRLAQAEANKALTAQIVEAQLQGARAQLASAQANLEKVETGARGQERAEADAQVSQAQSSLDNAKANLDRSANLFASGAISKQQLDAAQLQYDVAKSNCDVAEQRRNLVYEGARPEDVKLAQAQVEQAKAGVATAEANMKQNDLRDRELEVARSGVVQAYAALNLAKASTAKTSISEGDIRLAKAGVTQAEASLSLAQSQLDSARITSPVSGSVAKKTVEIGETVSPGLPLIQVVTRGAMDFHAAVSEMEVRKVTAGQSVEVTADALPEAKFAATVAEVLPAGDKSTRSFDVRVIVPNPQGRLKQGMFARGLILLTRKEAAVLVRKDAAIRDKDGSLYVFVVQGQTARKRPIITGLEAVNTFEVLEGLSAGENVVVAGQTSLADGDVVAVQPENGGGQG
jgi:HlyD family secretion protein